MPAYKSQAQDIHVVLLKLYRLSHELPIGGFQDAALEEIKTLLPFDSSMWGTGNLRNGLEMHTVHLHQKSPEMLVEYGDLNHQDNTHATLIQAPRVTIAVNADQGDRWRDAPELKDFLLRYQQENSLITAAYNTQDQTIHWMSLYRADRGHHCTESERELLGTLAPHVMQALALNRLTHLERMAAADRALLPHGAAIVDSKGRILHIDAYLQALMRVEWNDWSSAMLPYELLSACQTGNCRYLGRSCVIECKFEHGLLFLRARARCKADALTQREQTIARFIGQGLSHKEIALKLNRAPATVRNQIQMIYSKLEVSNIASLIEEMRKAA